MSLLHCHLVIHQSDMTANAAAGGRVFCQVGVTGTGLISSLSDHPFLLLNITVPSGANLPEIGVIVRQL